MLIFLLTLGVSLWAEAATIYRWIDKQGRTHFGDAVPSEYKDVARRVVDTATYPSIDERRQASERAASQAEKSRAARTGDSSPAASAPAAAASSPPGLKRPSVVPSEDTDCETWRLLYRESLECFGPYRTVRGATKAEAFDHCTPVSAPPPRCEPGAP